jgi:glycine betaine/proline transport system permease protein
MSDAQGFNILDPFSSIDLGLADSADGVKQWAIANRGIIQPIKKFFNEMIVGIATALNAVPPLIMLILLVLVAWQAAGRRVAILVAVSMTVLGFLAPNAWGLAMTPLAIVVSSGIL